MYDGLRFVSEYAVMSLSSTNPLRRLESYQDLYAQSLQSPETFWLQQAQRLHWIKEPTVADQSSFDPLQIAWYPDGVLNACYNCVDRHAETTPDKTAIIFEADTPGQTQRITYQDLQAHVCKFANILKSLGVQKGDVVTLYLPMIPELVYAMLACARIGAIHAVVFSGFSASALNARFAQARSKLIITCGESARGGKLHNLLQNVEEAIALNRATVEKVLVIDAPHSAALQNCDAVQGYSYQTLQKVVSDECAPTAMQATDPLFVLYTSGSTGKPKGVLHATGGYLTYAALTHHWVFDLQPDDVYFCTADIGWITGHTYGVYGPLCNGATLVLFQGTPAYPTVGRFWEIIDQHHVSLFYTAPTALRSISKLDQGEVDRASLASLRILASVGEPIDPPTWQWYFEKVGRKRCPVMDTWWQTESGGVLICPLLDKAMQKPSCAAKPFFGIEPAIVKEGELGKNEKGALCIKRSWPGQTIGVLGDELYFKQSYFSLFPGYYASGDNAQEDDDGDFWILGRIDDVLNVSGHRLNSAEIEQAVMAHATIAEACVVGFPHDVKGQGICVFAVPHYNIQQDSALLLKELKAQVRQTIGPIATPDRIILVADLPRTRSGKIVRRLLRKIAAEDTLAQEDVSTLANPESISAIQKVYEEAA